MNMNTHTDQDKAIEGLVGGLKPVQSLNATRLWVSAGALLCVLSACILSMMGLRPDIHAALESGTQFWKSGVFILLALAGVWGINGLSRPALRPSKIPYLLLVGGAIILIAQFTLQSSGGSAFGLFNTALDKASYGWSCFLTVSSGGIASFFTLWAIWLRKTASAFPQRLGFAAGALCGSLTALVYSMHCMQDNIAYIALYYGGSIFVLGGLGALFGRFSLKW